MKRSFVYSLFCTALLITQSVYSQNLQKPSEFLGYELGSSFSRHHQVIDYFHYLADFDNRIQLKQYGNTYENRPLYYSIITAERNHDQLEEIRKSNLARTGLADYAGSKKNIPIIWLSFNIHGNEASSTEAAMNVAYQLLHNDQYAEWLENSVVILDPCINPDGRDRYVNFYNQYGAKPYNANPETVEHNEPWPGGRPNHYLFDLNRDWAWQSQTESKARMKAYHEWMPHIHVDFHEQSYNSPYYFAPAAEPFHPVISQWQRDFQTAIGKNHAKYFDDNNWLYFTRERFDLFYPSYGDTYPTYNGAIGMTYEQAGHGRAGLGVITAFGDTLTLKDRIAHHSTTALSTIEIAVERKEGLINNFEKYFSESMQGKNTPYASYLIKWNKSRKNDFKEFLSFLDLHKINYMNPAREGSVSAFHYHDHREKNVTFDTNDLIIQAAQSKSKLIQALFDPKPNFSDSLTYDITAWGLPYAYDFEAYATDRAIPGNPFSLEQLEPGESFEEDAYAYIIPYTDFSALKATAYLLKTGFKLRVSTKDLQFNGEKFPKGSIIITKRNNEHLKDINAQLNAVAEALSLEVFPLQSGFADQKYDVGSSEIRKLQNKKVAVLMGEGTSSLSYGQIWYYFEQELQYPLHSIRVSDAHAVTLNQYDVLILPSGSFNPDNEALKTKLMTFMRQGGRVVSLASANQLWKNSDDLSLKQKVASDSLENAPLLPYEKRERYALQKSIFGAIYKVEMDTSHPLAYGLTKNYYSLKTSATAYDYLPERGNVGIIKNDKVHLSGFSGNFAHKRQLNSLVFGSESIGRGQIVYLIDDPLFRAFWKRGRLLMGNAVFMPW